MIDKKKLSERDICTKYITPALEKAGWDKQLQILEEVSFTDGKIYVRGKITVRGTRKRADYILYYKPNITASAGLLTRATTTSSILQKFKIKSPNNQRK